MITENDIPCASRGRELYNGVFLCSIHGRCSLDRTHSRLRPCIACGDRSEPPPPPKKNLSCVYRGKELETERCLTCMGNVQVKVYDCSIFKKCQIGNGLAHIHSCLGCPKGEDPC